MCYSLRIISEALQHFVVEQQKQTKHGRHKSIYFRCIVSIKERTYFEEMYHNKRENLINRARQPAHLPRKNRNRIKAENTSFLSKKKVVSLKFVHLFLLFCIFTFMLFILLLCVCYQAVDVDDGTTF